jgi:peptidoglycan hydrolase CwlO-like protein
MPITMNDPEKLQYWRKQRNIFAVAAVLIIITGMAISLPQALERRRQLKAADADLVDLQSQLLTLQEQIRTVQAQIVQVQAEIVKERH